MTMRFEFDDVSTNLEIVGPGTDLGTELGEDELGPGVYALVIGNPWASAYAIEGTLAGLAQFAQRLTFLVAQAVLATQAQPSDLGVAL